MLGAQVAVVEITGLLLCANNDLTSLIGHFLEQGHHSHMAAAEDYYPLPSL